MRRFSPPNNEQRKQNIGFMRFGMGFMRFRMRNALNPLVFQWDSWDLVQEMLWIHCCSIGFPLGFNWFLNPKLGFSRRVLFHRGWPPMLINRVGPTQSSIKKTECGCWLIFGVHINMSELSRTVCIYMYILYIYIYRLKARGSPELPGTLNLVMYYKRRYGIEMGGGGVGEV